MLKPEASAIINMREPACLRYPPTVLAEPSEAASIPVLALAAIIDQITQDMPLKTVERPSSSKELPREEPSLWFEVLTWAWDM